MAQKWRQCHYKHRREHGRKQKPSLCGLPEFLTGGAINNVTTATETYVNAVLKRAPAASADHQVLSGAGGCGGTTEQLQERIEQLAGQSVPSEADQESETQQGQTEEKKT